MSRHGAQQSDLFIVVVYDAMEEALGDLLRVTGGSGSVMPVGKANVDWRRHNGPSQEQGFNELSGLQKAMLRVNSFQIPSLRSDSSLNLELNHDSISNIPVAATGVAKQGSATEGNVGDKNFWLSLGAAVAGAVNPDSEVKQDEKKPVTFTLNEKANSLSFEGMSAADVKALQTALDKTGFTSTKIGENGLSLDTTQHVNQEMIARARLEIASEEHRIQAAQEMHSMLKMAAPSAALIAETEQGLEITGLNKRNGQTLKQMQEYLVREFGVNSTIEADRLVVDQEHASYYAAQMQAAGLKPSSQPQPEPTAKAQTPVDARAVKPQNEVKAFSRKAAAAPS
ncbi:MAG: hypothetical protein ACOYK8_08995 [Alphaproteobacteria bacterium]